MDYARAGSREEIAGTWERRFFVFDDDMIRHAKSEAEIFSKSIKIPMSEVVAFKTDVS